MMNNLFNVFDPSTSEYTSLNWLSIMTPMLMLPYLYWNTPSRIQNLFFILNKHITNELKNNITKNNSKALLLMFIIFFNIICNNILGLFPYIFTATSHLVMTLTLALPLWITLMIFGWIKTANHMFSHLVPLGTPLYLSFFMVFIETISNVIRPITLSVRLAANMIAGHLLLSLLSKLSEKTPLLFIPTALILLLLLMLEFTVSMIQSYVFMTLASLYLNEIN